MVGITGSKVLHFVESSGSKPQPDTLSVTSSRRPWFLLSVMFFGAAELLVADEDPPAPGRILSQCGNGYTIGRLHCGHPVSIEGQKVGDTVLTGSHQLPRRHLTDVEDLLGIEASSSQKKCQYV